MRRRSRPGGRGSTTVRRAFAVHVGSTVLVTLVVAGASALAVTAVAVEEARAAAAVVAETVAHAVAAPLATHDLTGPVPGVSGTGDDGVGGAREALLAEVGAFIDAGIITRAKVWRVEGDEAVVVFSDEPRNEGWRRPFDRDLAARLDAGEVVVWEVPEDEEHRYELGLGETLEAFIGFDDADGHPMRLEVYLPSAAPATADRVLLATLPVAVAGPLLLGSATLPLSLWLARRLRQREAERHDLLQAALAASDRERRRLAGRLHDGIVQDLAGVGLTLDGLGRVAAAPGFDEAGRRDQAARLEEVSRVVDADLSELRSLLSELAPPELDGSLGTALQDLAADLGSPRVRIDLDLPAEVPVAAGPAALVYRVARELVRNAVEHAGPAVVRVSVRRDGGDVVLQVVDDGGGFDPAAPVEPGHVGLVLIRQAVLDAGGVFDLATGPDGTAATVRVPAEEGTAPTG